MILSTISSTLGAIIYAIGFYTKDQLGIFLSLLFDLGISVYLCMAPIVMITFVKELRKITFICCFKSVASTYLNEQNVYFQQLQMQWS